MDSGFIEIGSIMTRASAEVVSRLKSILDGQGIFYIADGVEFNPAPINGDSKQTTLRSRVKRTNPVQIDSNSGEQLLVDLEKYQELIVPDLYDLNFMSLIYLDPDEADFLASLIYGEHRES